MPPVITPSPYVRSRRHNRINCVKIDPSSLLVVHVSPRVESREGFLTNPWEESVDCHCSSECPGHSVSYVDGQVMMVELGSAEGIVTFAGCLMEMELWCESEWSCRRDCAGKPDLRTLLQRRLVDGVTTRKYSRKCQIWANQNRVDANAVSAGPGLVKRGSWFVAPAEPRSAFEASERGTDAEGLPKVSAR